MNRLTSWQSSGQEEAMTADLLRYLEKVKSNFGEGSKAYQSLNQAAADHLDLQLHVEGGRVRLCAAGVNCFVDQMEIDRGTDIYVYPFIHDNGSILFSSPSFFYVGSRNSHGFGIRPASDWEENMKSHSINPDLIKKVRDFLTCHVAHDFPDDQKQA